MNVAYKYFELDSAVAVVFEQSPEQGAEMVFETHQLCGPRLRIGDTSLLPLTENILKMLPLAEAFYYAESPKKDMQISFVERIPLDRLTIGKILAYCERG